LHYALESPEVLNVYRGNVVLNQNGEAIIELPNYFNVININFSYHLTPIGSNADLYVKKEIVGNTFEIAGGKPGQKVSWIVYAERNDKYLQMYPNSKMVEMPKGDNAGKYLIPELYNQPKEKGIFNHLVRQFVDEAELKEPTKPNRKELKAPPKKINK
jgi:hypothetical protein